VRQVSCKTSILWGKYLVRQVSCRSSRESKEKKNFGESLKESWKGKTHALMELNPKNNLQ
jgi:hypothetical protein